MQLCDFTEQFRNSNHSASAHGHEVPARHPTPVGHTTQKLSDTTNKACLLHCPAKDSPWDPWDPISGFPIAGFSYSREKQPQAPCQANGRLQASLPEHEHQHHGHHFEPLGNHRDSFSLLLPVMDAILFQDAVPRSQNFRTLYRVHQVTSQEYPSRDSNVT